MSTNLTFDTHEVTLFTIGEYTKAIITLKSEITSDWFDVIINGPYATRYAEGERILFSNFCKSLSSFRHHSISVFSFDSEGQYYLFCIKNDLPFEEQEWFKVLYFKSNLVTTCASLQNLSIELLRHLHPERLNFPSNFPDFALIEDKSKKFFRTDALYIQKIFSKNNISQFYHTTSSKNIPSIKNLKGIHSIESLQKLGVKPDFVSSNSSRYIDDKKGVKNYVHLSYEPDYPMIKKALNNGTISSYETLIIDPIVALMSGSMFCKKNLVTTNILPTENYHVLEEIPFNRFHGKQYWSLSEEDRQYYMAEILIPEKIGNSFILNWSML